MSIYVRKAHEYAEGVVSGEIVAGKWTRLACQRQLDDLERWSQDGEYYFDEDEAHRVCAFIEELPHVKGQWARGGRKIELEPWQCFRLVVVYGWQRTKDGKRRFRTAYTEVARKNAKTTIAAGEALFLLLNDDEPGAEVVSAAVHRDQAKICWGIAKQMIAKSADLRNTFGVEDMAHSIVVPDTGSNFLALARDSGGHDGRNIHGAIVDELHAHKERDMWEVLETATGSREQPLITTITTAGSDRAGICFEQRTYVQKVLEGVIDDETYFGVVYTLDEGDEWDDEAVWPKANPNLGVSVSLDDLRAKAKKAIETPAAVAGFKTKHQNVWVSADAALFNILAWDQKCKDTSIRIEDFRGCPCWIGLDLASRDDLSAAVLLFEGDTDKFYEFPHLWLPEAAVERSRNSQYRGWVDSGLIEVSDGEIIDLDLIEERVEELSNVYGPASVPYDPFQATQLSVHLAEKNVPMVETPQNVRNLSEPTKELGALILQGNIVHDGNPVMTWMISNVVGHYDAKEHVYPRKQYPENKIDGPVALIMALGMAIRQRVEIGSIYGAHRGLRAV